MTVYRRGGMTHKLWILRTNTTDRRQTDRQTDRQTRYQEIVETCMHVHAVWTIDAQS